MDEDYAVIALYLLLKRKRNLLLRKRKSHKKKQAKRVWASEWLARKRSESVYYKLHKELTFEDSATMRECLLLDKDQFKYLLDLVSPMIQKQDTIMRQSVPAVERLSLTLRYLATGETRRSLSLQFGVSHNLLSTMIPEVCRAIYKVLQPTYISIPKTAEEWHKVADGFYDKCDFPNCLGALVSKRVLICKSLNCGLEVMDYNEQYSVLLITLVDADSKFLYVDIKPCGACQEGIWNNCTLKEKVDGNILQIPQPKTLPKLDEVCPYVFVGDDSFPMRDFLVKSYKGRNLAPERNVFNHRVDRVRRTSENAIGILAAKFRIFKQPIKTYHANVKDITLAALALHNMLLVMSKDTYSPPDLFDREDIKSGTVLQGQWRNYPQKGVAYLHVPDNGYTQSARKIRDTFTLSFQNEGAVAH